MHAFFVLTYNRFQCLLSVFLRVAKPLYAFIDFAHETYAFFTFESASFISAFPGRSQFSSILNLASAVESEDIISGFECVTSDFFVIVFFYLLFIGSFKDGRDFSPLF